MRKVFVLGKFVMAIIVIIAGYRTYLGLGRSIMDREDDSMAPAVRPAQWVWCNKDERHASQLKKDDIIIYRHPEYPKEIYVARVKGVPGDVLKEWRSRNTGQIIEEQFIPRGYVWVLLDDVHKKPDSRTFGQLHEQFIVGKVKWLKFVREFKGRE